MTENQNSGIDYDLEACMEWNPQPFEVEAIARVLAVWEGENNGDDWRWILALKDGRYVFLQGGCDYTGWECQSWATSVFADTPEAAALLALGNGVVLTGKSPANAGMGHMLSLMAGTYMENVQEVYEALLRQLTEGKSQTWWESKQDEMGDYPIIDPRDAKNL